MHRSSSDSILRMAGCLGAVLTLLAAALLVPAVPASAAGGDIRYVSPGGSDTTNCASAGAPCQTITYALGQSNPGDTLLLDAGYYYENLTIGKSIRIVQNPAVSCPFWKYITYPGIWVFVPCATIDGDQNGRVIDINLYSAQVSLEKITIRNGEVTNSSGAGIRNNGILYVDDVTLHHNHIIGTNFAYRGGAIDNQHELTLRGSAVYSNSAYDGGGISSTGPLVVQYTQIYNNSAARFGGGIWVPYGATSTLENTTLFGNSAGTAGGGMDINQDGIAGNRGERHYFKNVTFSGNTAVAFGGGLVSYLRVEMDHCTLAANSAPDVGAELHLFEYQTLPESGFPHSLITSTIVANPSATQPLCWVDDPASFTLSAGGNLSSDYSCDFNQFSDLEGTDPGLLALASNGGRVQTRALPFGSPAIDHAWPYSLGADARGVLAQDGDLNGSVVADVGAYEFAFIRTFLPVVRR